MEKLSVYIITKNGSAHIGEVLAAASPIADEIIVADSGSTDDTPAIVKACPKAKYLTHPWKNHCDQKRFAEGKCKNNWVLNLDDDEVISPALASEIEGFMGNPLSDGCRLKIGDMFPHYQRPRALGRTYNIVRMYRKDRAYMPDAGTADRAIFNSPAPDIYQFQNFIYHYSYQGLSHLITKLNTFTDAVVENMLAKGKTYNPFRIYIEFPTQFLKYYFLKRYIFNGYYGFLVATVYSFFRMVRLAKYREALKHHLKTKNKPKQ